MITYFGVDSASPAHQGLGDLIAKELGVYPSVWGRYLHTVPGTCTGLSMEEIAWFHKLHIAIQVIYSKLGPSDVQGSYTDGWAHAQSAINQAAALKISEGTAIFMDIEAGWYPTSNFMEGFADNILRAKYVPGFYGATNSNAFNVPYAAMAGGKNVVVYASEWEEYPSQATPPPGPAWSPQYPPGFLERVVAWQYVENVLGGTADFNLHSQKGYDLCYGSVGPITYKVKDKASMKVKPNHLCKASEKIAKGIIVTPTGGLTPHWMQVVDSQTKVTGWLLRANLQQAS